MRKKVSIILFYMLILPLLVFPLQPDIPGKASMLKKQGKYREAQSLYKDWLETHASNPGPDFGLILIHCLRIPGPLKEDMALLENYLHLVPPGEDFRTLTKMAQSINELKEGRPSISDPLSPDWQNSARTRKEIYKDCLTYALSFQKQEDRLLWMDKAERSWPFFKTSPGWLYMRTLLLNCQHSKKRLLTLYPNSLEAGLVQGHYELYMEPSLLAGLSGHGQSAESRVLYYQCGAYQNGVHAETRKKYLLDQGLDAFIIKDKSIYKVIVQGKNGRSILDKLHLLGIKAFQIPQLP